MISETQVCNNRYRVIVGGRAPFARAEISGTATHPGVHSTVSFYCTPVGIIIDTRISGLPVSGGKTGTGKPDIFGMYIRNAGNCVGCSSEEADGKSTVKGKTVSRGVMPMIFGRGGDAWSSFFTDKLSPADVVGRRLIVHQTGCREVPSDPYTDDEYIADGIITAKFGRF